MANDQYFSKAKRRSDVLCPILFYGTKNKRIRFYPAFLIIGEEGVEFDKRLHHSGLRKFFVLIKIEEGMTRSNFGSKNLNPKEELCVLGPT